MTESSECYSRWTLYLQKKKVEGNSQTQRVQNNLCSHCSTQINISTGSVWTFFSFFLQETTRTAALKLNVARHIYMSYKNSGFPQDCETGKHWCTPNPHFKDLRHSAHQNKRETKTVFSHFFIIWCFQPKLSSGFCHQSMINCAYTFLPSPHQLTCLLIVLSTQSVFVRFECIPTPASQSKS